MKQQQAAQPQIQPQEDYSEEESSFYSSEDEDAVLLTDKVQQKLLQTVAKIRNKDPSIYKVVNPIFAEEDFEQANDNDKNTKKSKEKKFTYKDLVKSGPGKIQQSDEEESEQEELPPAMEQKKAKNKFKQALLKQKNAIQDKATEQEDLFTVKRKVKKQTPNQDNPQTQQLQPQSKSNKKSKKLQKSSTQKLIQKVWNPSQELDQTDIFLRDYITNRKWLSKHINGQKNGDSFNKIDQQDEQRSVQMDEHQARYNFRFQEPDGDKIVQYPRKIEESMRLKPQSRKQKRKKVQQRKAEQEKRIRQQVQKKRQQLKENILAKLQQKQQEEADEEVMDEQEENFDHDWFFCDDCGKPFHELQTNYQCQECVDYMLCQECFELIIHKHALQKSTVPVGFGAPQESISTRVLSKLQPCKVCRRRIPQTLKHYSYQDRAKNVSLMCQRCYDESGLDVKKKFSQVQARINSHNIAQYLQKDPQKVKQLTSSKQIEQMVDEYLKYQFEDVIGGGLKTKFKYLNVKPQSYGLSDQQILYGDDRQLNRYVSIKKLVPYRQQGMRLRNSIFNKKVKTINKSVMDNKRMIQRQEGERGVQRRLKRGRMIEKMRRRGQVMRRRRERVGRMRVVNISKVENERRVFVPGSRLESYGVGVGKGVGEGKGLGLGLGKGK